MINGISIPPVVMDPSRLAALDAYAILDTAAEQGFEDIVHLATQLCAVPVALVSLVDQNRQWFKARVGFPTCETDLDRSVCKFVLDEPDLLVIPDLTADPRTRANPLVTGEPRIRFYAGAPLRTPEGKVLGSLCVIDSEPRPEGLTEAQAEALRRLARQTMAQMELRRAVSQKDAALTRLQSSEGRYRTIYDSITDYAIVVMDLEGKVTNWNEGATRILGWSPEDICGKPADVFFTEEDRANGIPAQEMHSALTEGRGIDERWHLRKGGERFWANGEMQALRTDDGAPVGFVKILRDRTAQHQAAQQLATSEERWRSLFENMQEGFFLGEIVRDAMGQAVDYRFLEINPAFARQSGLPTDSVGRTIRSFVPDIDQWVVDTYADVVETGTPALFDITVPELSRSFEVRAQKEWDDRFSCMFLDVTGRKRSDVRRAAMAELSDRLRDLNDKPAIARIASEVMGRTLGLSHAGYGQVDPEQETILVVDEWSAPGLRNIGGLHQFRDYGSYIEDLKAGREVIVADTRSDPRTANDAAALAALNVAAIFNLPVMEHGRFRALFYALHAMPHAWAEEDIAFVRNVADRTRSAIARVEAEEEQRVLNLELSHRLKNTLALVQSIASQTLRNAETMPAARDALAARLIALGKSHDILLSGRTNGAAITAIIEGALALHQDRQGRFRLSGPDLLIGPSAALSLSLMLHELATNATKYGALSRTPGYVDLTWIVRGTGTEAEFQLIWTEHGGPSVQPPSRTGFGSRLIQRGLAGGSVEMRYLVEGVICILTTPVMALMAGS